MDGTLSRRRVLSALAAGSLTGLAGCSQSTTRNTDAAGTDADGTVTAAADAETSDESGTETAAGPLPDAVGLETVATGLQAPVDLAVAPDADRRYVADQAGQIRVHEPSGLREEPLVDLQDAVEFGGEKGLLGLALHPAFASNRRLFVRYSAPRREGTPASYSHTFVLAEFTASADGRLAPRDSERTVLEIPEPQGNHNSGSLAFGPEGYLYVGVGDGGAGADHGPGHVGDWYDANAGGNGQDVTENLLGSLLRIDVDGRADGKPYAVPDDNPLVGQPGLDEHYAWGLRNPWGIAFDGEDCYLADVGQNAYEEVNLVERGGNYGWNVTEGTHCFGAEDCPDGTPADVRGGEQFVDPVIEYPHSGGDVTGISVIGGHVYRGSAVPGLRGRYVFGDLSAGDRLFTAAPRDGDELWPVDPVPIADGDELDRVLAFGREDGDVYVLGTGDGGGVHRVAPQGE